MTNSFKCALGTIGLTFLLGAYGLVEGVELRIDRGTDPDIAVGADGILHLVYTQGSQVRYASYNTNLGFLRKSRIGSGSDPHIALDSTGTPYAAWDSGSKILLAKRLPDGKKFRQVGATNQQCGGCPGIRKPRLAIDLADDTVYLHFEDRKPYVIKVRNDNLGSRILLADDADAGSIAVAAGGPAHNVMRTVPGLLYRQLLPDGSMTALLRLNNGASDFCDVAYDVFDPATAKVVGIQAGKLGNNVEFITVQDRSVSVRRTGAELIQGLNHDFVGPSIAVDKFNRSFITFTGRRRAYYFVVDERDRFSTVEPLASVAGMQGAKFTYPEISPDPNGGAWAVWQDKRDGAYSIYIRPIQTPGGAGSAPQIAAAGIASNQLSSAAGGLLGVRAYVADPDNDLAGVELLVEGEPTGAWLGDDGQAGDAWAGDGVYSLDLEVPPATLAPGRYRIGLRAVDRAGHQSDEWPYLKIDAVRPSPGASCTEAGAVREIVQRALAHDPNPPELIAGYGCSALSTAGGGRLELLAIARPGSGIAAIDATAAQGAQQIRLEERGGGLFLLAAPAIQRGQPQRRESLRILARSESGDPLASWPEIEVR